MKKLPKIYQNESIKKINNNKSVFDSLKDDLNRIDKEKRIKEESQEELEFKGLSVRDKLNELINQKSYIFNTKISLVFSDHEESTQIAGVVNNHIITMDNKIIKIDDIKDIKILK